MCFYFFIGGRNMQYLGGKSKIRKQVAAFLESVRKPDQAYFEPFCGGGWVLQEMTGKRIASDGNKALIAMYKSLQQGWVPPDFVSEDEWRYWRSQKGFSLDPMMAFCGFGCSFGGIYFRGYARSEGKTCYAATTKRSLLKQLELIKDVEFIYGLFNEHKPKDMLVYCDPPYQNTTNYCAFSGFDHDLFWQTMRAWSKQNTVVISEYQAPDDFECVAEFQSRMGLRVKGDKQEVRIERLFMLKGE